MTEQGPIAGARRLLRQCRYASLGTLSSNGGPFVSLVAMATDSCGSPLLLLSDLAAHARNVAADGRVSLLLDGTQDCAERLTGIRLTLTGTLEVQPRDAMLQRRYLAVHPDAGMLFDMADFRFYRMTVQAGHQVEGFGRIDAIPADALLVDSRLVSDLAASSQGAIDHMAQDHGDALSLMAGTEGPATLHAIDADGMDLTADGRVVRVMFSERLGAAPELRTAILDVVRQIRRNSPEIATS